MRQKCGLHVAWGNKKLVWQCDNDATGCMVGFFADVALYRCHTCAAAERIK